MQHCSHETWLVIDLDTSVEKSQVYSCPRKLFGLGYSRYRGAGIWTQ